MKIAILLLLFLLQIADSKSKNHQKNGSNTKITKRFEIVKKDSMPRLGDEPSIDIEDINTPQNDVLPGSIGELSKDDVDDDDDDNVDDDSDAKASKLAKKRSKSHPKTVSAENAANFGNNVKTKPGINPAAAFVTQEENHKGFKGKDKSVTASKKSKTAQTADTASKSKKTAKSKYSTKGSFHKGDKDIISKIKGIAKEINDVEAKKKKIQQQIAKNKKKKKKQASTDLKNILEEDTSTMNSHGRNQVTQQLLVNQTKGIDSFQCPWSCFWSCNSYCPRECCNNPYNCSLTCQNICAPHCGDKCCAPGSKKLPKLTLPFLKPSPKPAVVAARKPTWNEELAMIMKNQNSILKTPFSPSASSVNMDRLINSRHFTSEIIDKIKMLREQSNYAANLLGLNYKCPSICTKVCTPIVCQRYCCTRPSLQQQWLSANRNPVAPYLRTNLPDPRSAAIQAHQHVYCSSPTDCPPGGIVNANYCPPICRRSCIQQCPNECCANFGRPAG